MITEFHLFAGIGGGIYGGELLEHKCCAGVEIDSFCKEVLRQRQADGWLPQFPIYDDVTKIDGSKYKGNFDVLCGGFPCQAFSTAAHGKNIAEKNLWDYMLKFVKESDAPIVFGENVVFRAISKAKIDLQNIGYKVTTCKLSCKDLGADHQRNRFWVMAVKDQTTFDKLSRHIQALPQFCGQCWADAPLAEYPSIVENRREQLKGIGNAQSPLVAATAFRILVQRHLDGSYDKLEASEEEISKVFKRKKTWIVSTFGEIGGIHTPTTMANYHCKSMMKHRSCQNFVKVFGVPQPLNGEYLMGMPIGISSPNSIDKTYFESWKNKTLQKF